MPNSWNGGRDDVLVEQRRASSFLGGDRKNTFDGDSRPLVCTHSTASKRDFDTGVQNAIIRFCSAFGGLDVVDLHHATPRSIPRRATRRDDEEHDIFWFSSRRRALLKRGGWQDNEKCKRFLKTYGLRRSSEEGLEGYKFGLHDYFGLSRRRQSDHLSKSASAWFGREN